MTPSIHQITSGLLLGTALLLSAPLAHANEVVRRDGKPDMILVDDTKLMDAALAEAKSKLGEFVLAVKLEAEGTADFNIKKAYPTPSGGREFIWITVLSYKDGVFKGRIANDPVNTREVVADQIVEVPRAEVADWMYMKNGALVGGYSIVALAYGTEEQVSYEKSMGVVWSNYAFLKLKKK